MKIIHTADIHLDSPLSQVANRQKRRLELLQALSNMSEYANNNNVCAIIVAGDLFDDNFTTSKTVQGVADIVSNSNATWFVLKGNHGNGSAEDSPYQKLQQICPQIKFFGDDWQTYSQDGVNICGRELGIHDEQSWQQLQFPQEGYNILVLHADIDDDRYGVIDKKAISQSGANYVALGHRHTFCQHKFGKVLGAYCGALEPRGFDESAQTGFVVIDTDKNSLTFVPQAIRKVQTVTVDVTNVQSEIALQNALLSATSQVVAHDYLNLVLVGDIYNQLNVEIATECLKGRFFALRVDDKTHQTFDLQKISQEVSLRGEFVRKVLQLPENEQGEILKLGLTLLGGGDLQ